MWLPVPQRTTCRAPTSASPGTAPDTASTAPSGVANFSQVDGNQYERIAHLRSFGLPGGDAAVREGWRSAASLLFEVFGPEPAVPDAGGNRRGNPDWTRPRSAICSSAGSTWFLPQAWAGSFDAVACITGVARQNRFEGQAAMLLENEIGAFADRRGVCFTGWGLGSSDFGGDGGQGRWGGCAASSRHGSTMRWWSGFWKSPPAKLKQIVLSGGVFQNRYLTERAAGMLGVARI